MDIEHSTVSTSVTMLVHSSGILKRELVNMTSFISMSKRATTSIQHFQLLRPKTLNRACKGCFVDSYLPSVLRSPPFFATIGYSLPKLFFLKTLTTHKFILLISELLFLNPPRSNCLGLCSEKYLSQGFYVSTFLPVGYRHVGCLLCTSRTLMIFEVFWAAFARNDSTPFYQVRIYWLVVPVFDKTSHNLE
jgi:hypothetical protein